MSGENVSDNEVKKKSFSGCLVGLIAIVLFIAFALSYSFPSFMFFQKKAKQSEAKQNLGAIYTSQIAYHGEFGNYAGGDNCFGLLGWQPEDVTKYSYYCGKDKIASAYSKTKCPAPDVPEYKDGAFTLFAVGNIDWDDTCDIWTLNNDKYLENIKDDVSE